MKNKLMMLVGAIALVSLTATVQAAPITGTIQMSGSVTFDTSSLLTATSASFPGAVDAVVTSGSGSYLGVPALITPVTWSGFSFAATGAQSIPSLWSFNSALLTYTFDLDSISNISRSTADSIDSLDISGKGIVNITGIGSPYEATVANWSFKVTDTSGGQSGLFTFAFADSNTAVPDGGTTVILLGAALSGLGLIRRKLA